METKLKSGGRRGAIGLAVVLWAMATQAGALELRGRVVQANGAAVPDAEVRLVRMGAAAKTGADGAFVLNGSSAVRPREGRGFAYRLRPGFLEAEVRSPVDFRLEVCDASGRVRGSLARRLEAGAHRIGLGDALSPAGSAGLRFLRVRFGDEMRTHAFILSGEGPAGSVFAPARRGGAAPKGAAAVDTLRIRKAGFRDYFGPVADYAAGDLGDLVLSPDDGAICPGQRSQRTDDGFDVVYCEALFEQPPRVRLPPAGASAAYAMMTSEGFVTPAGETYPYADRAGQEPEMRRHASALYLLALQGGKMTAFRPAIVFAESLFLAPLLGKVFEGRISKRIDGRYEPDPSLPIRVRILAERYPGDIRASAFRAKTVIENLASAVAASDGSCMPSLASYGPQGPFGAGAVEMPVGRVPSMHVFGDDELVFELIVGGGSAGTLMGRGWFFTPLDLVKNALSAVGAYDGVGHGTPGYIPYLSLHPAAGGGAACAPK